MKTHALHIFLILLFVVGGCSSIDKESLPPLYADLPPPFANWDFSIQLKTEKQKSALEYLNRLEAESTKNKDKKNSFWWIHYKKAQVLSQSKDDLPQACQLFSQLSEEREFPLRRVAELRGQELCPGSSTEKIELSAAIKQYDRWFLPLYLRGQEAKAQLEKDYIALTEIYEQRSELTPRREDKVLHLKKALEFLTLLKNESQIDTNEIEDRLQSKLYKVSPRENPKPENKDLLPIANDHRHSRDFKKAEKFYRQVINNKKNSFQEILSAYRGLRTNYRLQLKRKEAIEITEALVRYVDNYYKSWKKKDFKLITDVHLTLARDLWTDQRRSEALAILDKILKNTPAGSLHSDVYWILGRMAEERSAWAEAIEFYDKALSGLSSVSDFKRRLLWHKGWNAMKLKNFSQAREIFLELKKITADTGESSKYSFWLGQSYKKGAEQEDSLFAAQKEFQELSENDPFSFYGYLAQRENKSSLPVKNLLKNKERVTLLQKRAAARLRPWIDPLFIEWLLATHENEIATLYLEEIGRTLTENLKVILNNDRKEYLELWASYFTFYARLEDFLSVFSHWLRMPTIERREFAKEFPTLLYPLPFKSAVEKASVQFGIPLEFIYAIMRQESSFHPQARSPMDAFGLMQLLPLVAQQTAEKHNLTYNETNDLFNPTINIPLGAAHLKELWTRYKGQMILVSASYNASEKAIQGWLERRFRGDVLEFIEDIPYDETRDYVKLVLRNFITYWMLNSKSTDLAFPEWTLEISP